jgi:hypothetical protein
MANLKNQVDNNIKKLMLNQGRFFIEFANFVMPRVLSNPAAPRGTHDSEKIGVRHMYPFLMQILLASLFSHFEKSKELSNKISKVERKSLVMFIEHAFGFLKKKGKFILENLDDQVLRDSLFSLVQARELTFETLTNAIQNIAIERYHKMGVKVEDILECESIVDAVSQLFLNNEVFMEIFHTHVWNVFFRGDLQSANRRARNLELRQNPSYTMTRSFAEIVAQNAVTFPLGAPQFVPAQTTRLLNAPVQSVHESSVPAQVLESLPESHPLMRRLDDTPVQVVHESLMSLPVQHVHDTTELVSAVVNDLFNQAITNVIDKSAEAIGAGNQAVLSRIFGEDSDVNALKEEVARQAAIGQSVAITDASAALEVAVLVNDAAKAGEPINPVSPPDSPGVKSLMASNAFLGEIQNLQSGMDHQSLPVGFSERVDDASFTITSILDQIVGLKSNTTSPLPPNSEVRAHFITSALSQQQCVKDGALGAHPPFSAADLSRSAAEPKYFESNLENTPPSGQSGTTLTHESADLLARLAISSKPLFTPPADYKPIVHSSEWTGIGVSPLAQSSSNPSGILTHLPPPNLQASSKIPPPTPSKTDLVRKKMNSGGVQSSGNPSGDAHSNVGVRVPTHADQSSFPPQGDVGGPPVQVLAQSVDPSSDSGGADHPKTPSRLNLWSSCITGLSTSSASQPDNSSSSRHKFFLWRRKLNQVNPSQGQTNDTRPPVAHSPGKNLSESAAANPLMLPFSSSPLGGNIGVSPGAHSPSDPHGFVPLPVPSSSSELGSAATAALLPHSCPMGHDIGGIERSGKMLDITIWYLIYVHLRHLGVPFAQAPLFSQIPPAILAQVVIVA